MSRARQALTSPRHPYTREVACHRAEEADNLAVDGLATG